MNYREILVANTRNQKRYKINTNAATVHELKDVMDANQNILVRRNNEWVMNTEPIDYAGLDFAEGITGSILTQDHSPIPETVEFKGQVKNPVILLTNSKDKVASGLDLREELLTIIENEDLEDDVYRKFNRYYKDVDTEDLMGFLRELDTNEEVTPENNNDPSISEVDAVLAIVKSLFSNGSLSIADMRFLGNEVLDIVQDNECKCTCKKDSFAAEAGTVSSDDIDEMISNLG